MVGVALDGRGLYGKWETASTVPSLDACNGHVGPIQLVCMYVCTCVYMYILMHVMDMWGLFSWYVCMCVYIYICMLMHVMDMWSPFSWYVCMYVCMYMCVHVCIHACDGTLGTIQLVCVCVCAYTYILMHVMENKHVGPIQLVCMYVYICIYIYSYM